MNKRIGAILAVVAVLVVAGMGYMVYSIKSEADKKDKRLAAALAEKEARMKQQQDELDSLRLLANPFETDSSHLTQLDSAGFQRELRENAEAVKQQMIEEYEGYLREAKRLAQKAGSQNAALRKKLEKEQARTQALLEELRNTQATDTAEITRLKGELANLREILRSYVAQVDELNRRNQELQADNQSLRGQKSQVEQQAAALATEKEQLKEKVAIAAQLDATGVSAQALNKKGKHCDKVKDTKKIEVRFTIARNVTASAGMRTIYIRILTPTGATLTQGGTFRYENQQLEYSIRREIEYTGEATSDACYWTVGEALTAGQYRADIFADGHHIGGAAFSLR